MTKSFHEDTNSELQAGLAALIGEEVLKIANEQCTSLPDNASPYMFADRVERGHPIFTSETTMATVAYIKLAGQNMTPGVRDNLRKAVEQFGHVEFVQAIEDALDTTPESSVKVASSTAPQYAFEDEGRCAYPLTNFSAVLDSANRLAYDYADARFPAPLMKVAAERVVEAAKFYGVDEFMLPDVIVKHATTRIPDFDAALRQIGLRVRNLGDAAKDAAEAYKTALTHDDSVDVFESALTAALRVQELDKAFGVKTGSENLDPLSLVFSGAVVDDVVKVANSSVCLFDSVIPGEVFAGICDRLPLPALFDEEAVTKIAAAVALIRKGEGIRATEVIDTLDGQARATLAHSLVSSVQSAK